MAPFHRKLVFRIAVLCLAFQGTLAQYGHGQYRRYQQQNQAPIYDFSSQFKETTTDAVGSDSTAVDSESYTNGYSSLDVTERSTHNYSPYDDDHQQRQGANNDHTPTPHEEYRRNPEDHRRRQQQQLSHGDLPDLSQTHQVNAPMPHREIEAPSVSKETDSNQRMISTTQMTNMHQVPLRPVTVTVAVVGRSGSGVSSTIRQLIGPNTKCEKEEGTETLQDVTEYTITNIPSPAGLSYQVKLVDIPGFVDGRTFEDDAQVLATLKSYVSEANPPDIFLALSRFDDNRINGVQSLFTQFLKRLDLFKNEFLGKLSKREMDIVFLLTRLMSETKTTQRRPATKIGTFRKVIEDYSSFRPQSMIVGDNHAGSEYGLKVENGYYRLPNKEHYPKNVWEALLNSTHLKSHKADVITAIMENREVEMKCEAQLIQVDWDEYDADANAFLYLLTQENLAVEDNEVNRKIQETYDGLLDFNDHVEQIIQKTALQLYLQNQNISEIQHMPNNAADIAAFFQKSSLISSTFPALQLNDAFGIEMREYFQPLTVKYGYDVLADELSTETPFKLDKYIPSAVGYKLPNFMKCKRFPRHETEAFKSYSHNITDYYQERLKHLKFKPKENITLEKEDIRDVKAKGGYNIAQGEDMNIATLTVVKEVRVLKCKISGKQRLVLNEDFLGVIHELQPVDLSNKDSVQDWKVFFGKYGSHIVSQGYGGGRVRGSVYGTNVKKALESQDSIDDTLNSIMQFSPFSIPDMRKPSYELFGGDLEDADKVRQLYDLSDVERAKLLGEWGNSLDSNFEMLKYEFGLKRMSKVIAEKVSPEMGQMVDTATDLLFRGELKHRRRKNAGTGNNRNTGSQTRRPVQKPSTPTPSRVYPSHNPHASINRDQVPISPSRTPYHSNSNTPLPNSGGGSSQSFYPASSQDNDQSQMLHSVVASEIQNTNQFLGVVEQEIETKRRKDAMLFQQLSQADQKRYEDGIRDIRERAEAHLKDFLRRNETTTLYFNRILENLRRDTMTGIRDTDRRIADLDRAEELEEMKHQLRMAEIERQNRKLQEEADAEKRRCSGFFGSLKCTVGL